MELFLQMFGSINPWMKSAVQSDWVIKLYAQLFYPYTCSLTSEELAVAGIPCQFWMQIMIGLFAALTY